MRNLTKRLKKIIEIMEVKNKMNKIKNAIESITDTQKIKKQGIKTYY